MQESKFLQELTIGEGYVVSFVLAQSGGADEAQLVVYYLALEASCGVLPERCHSNFCTAAALPQKGHALAKKAIIRMGDKTSHGGTVLEGLQFFVICGKPAAGVGHRVHCPTCAGPHVIIEGAVNATMMGIQIAVDGMKTSCGATLIASQTTDTIDVGASAGTTALPANATAAASHGAGSPHAVAANEAGFDDHFVLVDADRGTILPFTEYAIVRASGAIEHGVSDVEGKTHLLSSTVAAEAVDIYV